MKNISMQKLNTHLEDMQEFLERFALSTKQTFNLFEEKFEQINQRFEQINQRFEQVDKRFEQVDKRFEQVDRRFDRVEAAIAENKEAIYLNADTIARLMQKMDAEFAAATLQRQRIFDKLDNHENRIVRLESYHLPA